MTQPHKKEIEKRRTFGIISHPDAGKTTLTEKLLLFWRRHSAGPVPLRLVKPSDMPPVIGWPSKGSGEFP